MGSRPPSTGMMIIRVWQEGSGDERHLVARLSSRLDVEEAETDLGVADSVGGVLDRVREWLAAVTVTQRGGSNRHQ